MRYQCVQSTMEDQPAHEPTSDDPERHSTLVERLSNGDELALEELGLSINAFAYPNGDYGEREVAAVKEAGYACALTVDAGLNDADTDLFRLKRIGVDDGASATEMIVKASGIVDLVKRLGRSG